MNDTLKDIQLTLVAIGFATNILAEDIMFSHTKSPDCSGTDSVCEAYRLYKEQVEITFPVRMTVDSEEPQ